MSFVDMPAGQVNTDSLVLLGASGGPVGAALGALADALVSPDSANSSNEAIRLYLIYLHDLIRDVSKSVVYDMGQEYGAWVWAQQPAKDIGKAFETIQGNNSATIEHLKNTILPHSLKWLQGFIFSTGIVPLRNDVRALDNRVSFLEGWRGQINTWRHDYVDPHIQDWRQFHSWFDNNAAPAIATLRGWISKPATFADFAVPAIARPLLTYIASDQHNTLQDDYAQTMLAAWVDRPNTMWELILQWVVTDG